MSQLVNNKVDQVETQQKIGSTSGSKFGFGKKSGNQELSQSKLVVMWGLILIGYFLFVVQWYSIGNFAGGYNANIGTVTGNSALSSMPNWTITLMRGIGSILAGWLLAKIGHRYAVITVLSLMVVAFPFLIIIGTKWESNTPEGYNSTAFGLFLFFRLFLAIGGTTLITYTNSVIAKMPAEKRPTYMTINQFGFNGGAFFANIFFCFGLSSVINGNQDVWLGILSAFVVLIAVILVLYIFIGIEVVPVQKKAATQFSEANDITYGKVFKQSYTWKMSTIFIVWLVAVVFINSATMRTVIEQSPANLALLQQFNADNGTNFNAMSASTLGTASTVVVGSGFNWVWPTFICMFVAGFFVGLLFISPFSKTIYKRKFFIHLMFILGYVFAALSIMVGYFVGYTPVGLAFFFILIFISGMFLWAVQPVLLTLYQQAPQSSPKYAGIIAGLIWGIGYVGYTIVELTLSMIQSYAGTPGAFGAALANPSTEYVVSGGNIAVIVLFFIICLLIFIPIQLLPPAGTKDKDGNFQPFTKNWNPLDWNFKKSEIRIH